MSHSANSVTILGMGSINARQRYIVTSSLTGWAYSQNDLWKYFRVCLPHLFPSECGDLFSGSAENCFLEIDIFKLYNALFDLSVMNKSPLLGRWSDDEYTTYQYIYKSVITMMKFTDIDGRERLRYLNVADIQLPTSTHVQPVYAPMYIYI